MLGTRAGAVAGRAWGESGEGEVGSIWFGPVVREAREWDVPVAPGN